MQTELILTQGSNSTVRIHLLNEADAALSLTNYISAKFVMRSSTDSVALITKLCGNFAVSTTTVTPEPVSIRIENTYVEIDIVPGDTENLDPGTYLGEITFADVDGKEFVTDIFYVKLGPKVS
jgi:hypothetical protein